MKVEVTALSNYEEKEEEFKAQVSILMILEFSLSCNTFYDLVFFNLGPLKCVEIVIFRMHFILASCTIVVSSYLYELNRFKC